MSDQEQLPPGIEVELARPDRALERLFELVCDGLDAPQPVDQTGGDVRKELTGMHNKHTTSDGRKPPAPMIKVLGLWSNESKSTGRTYLSGRIGDLKIVIMEDKNHDPEDPKSPTHVLLVTAAAPREGGQR